MDKDPIIERITGFAGAQFGECKETETGQRSETDPLHKLFESDRSEMFEGSESFTWIDGDLRE
ncbi:MAG: hypothetical protein K6G27_04745 [Lachnospiraceae bacterium]|nr:hypothetical protein [Lachnospiraceae bacterium]